MKILILGAGQVGSSAAYHLSREEANEVTVVDQRPEVLRELQDRLDIRTVVGHAAHPDVLQRAGASTSPAGRGSTEPKLKAVGTCTVRAGEQMRGAPQTLAKTQRASNSHSQK